MTEASVCAVLPLVLRPWIGSESTLWRVLCLGPLSISIWAGIVFSARTRPYRAATSIVVRRMLQSFGFLTFGFSLMGVASASASRSMACYMLALFLSLMVSGGFFALVTSVAFRLASQRTPSSTDGSAERAGILHAASSSGR